MARYGNENAAAGGRSSSTADRDRSYGGGMGGLGRPGQVGRGGSAFATRAMNNPMQDAAFGTAVQGGLLAGMNPVQQPRRTPNPTPSYDMTLHNMFEAGKFAASLLGGGLGTLGALGKLAAGYGPQFTGYHGMVNGPGDYDPKNAAPMAPRPGLLYRGGY